MADDKHYVPGDYYRICERTGFKVRAGRTRKEWTQRYIRDQSWEPRQPQDFVKGVRDDQTVPEPRPRQIDMFQGPLGTTLTANFVPSSSAPWFIAVQSSIRMFIGDTLNIMLDTGVVAVANIVDVPSPTSIQIDRNLPWKASSGNVVINVTAESPPVISYPGLPD